MAIGTTVNVGLNATAVHRGFSKIGTRFGDLAKKMKVAGRAMLAPFVKLMAVLAPLLTVGAFARGIKDITDYGGAVSDLAARLGIAADEVVFLQEVFRRTGLEQDRMADSLQLMGRNVYEALAYGTSTYKRALDDLNLTGKDLVGLNLAQQFEIIATRIAALNNENQRASVSAALFGRQGRALVNTFKSWNQVSETSRKSVGGLGGSMNEMANDLDHVSDALGAMQGKFRQFFAGAVVEGMDELTSLADTVNSLDLTEAGKKFGAFASTIADTFKAGELGNVVWEGLKYAGERFAEILGAAATFFAEKLNEAVAKTELGKLMNLGGISPNITPKSVLGFEPITKPGAQMPTSRSFGEILKDTKGSMGSDLSAASIRDIMAAIDLKARISTERKAGTEEKYLRSMERHLDALVKRGGGKFVMP